MANNKRFVIEERQSTFRHDSKVNTFQNYPKDYLNDEWGLLEPRS